MGSVTTIILKMKKITDKKELIKLISFMTMGDGGIYRYTGNKNCVFIMNMITDNADYVQLCKDILENITTVRVVAVEKGDGRKPQLRLTTKSNPLFTTLRERIYIDTPLGPYKSLDPHALKLLDYEALSFLYMSDGSLKHDFRPALGMVNTHYEVTLNLKRLSYGDMQLLKNALKDKLGLEWNINRNNGRYYLRLRSKDIGKFMLGISPYIVSSFSYKILNEELLKQRMMI